MQMIVFHGSEIISWAGSAMPASVLAPSIRIVLVQTEQSPAQITRLGQVILYLLWRALSGTRLEHR
jgi:hypothetical protein